MIRLLLGASLLCSCSFVLDRTSAQCSTDEDCAPFPSSVCREGVCVRPETDGGTDGGGGVDAGFDAGLGPPGCFSGRPTTDSEFFNACTTASFLRFDNCRVTGVCDGGMPVALVKPDAGAAVPGGPIDGGGLENCYDPVARPEVIFMNGSTNFTPFIRAMVPVVTPSGFTIIWQPTSSCTGADTVFNVDPTRRVMRNPTNSNTSFAAYYTPASPNGTPCLLGNSPRSTGPGQEPVDIGQSDIFATTCPSGAVPFNTYDPGVGAFADVRHYLGPVQAMTFVVPAASTERGISAEAARQLFGAGQPIAPWTVPGSYWIRSPTTGTAGIISRGISVPATDLWGVDQRTAPNMVAQVKSVSTNAVNQTIGMLSMDFADRERSNLHILYFQPRGASYGFLPDARPTTRDKANVRDGHYPLWGPIHLYTRANNGDISAAARAFVTQFTVPRPEQSLLDAIIETANVPLCAMRVTRDVEMGPLSAWEAPFQCHCYYDAKVNGGNTCKSCRGPIDCPDTAPACNLGYCEKQ